MTDTITGTSATGTSATDISATDISARRPDPARLLAWYDRHARVLPWRAPPGRRADPYHVWLSEIMLQQTTVAAVEAHFRRFLALWPTVHDLAAAPQETVLAAWAGLGYYARARNLHAAARLVSGTMAGHFPDSEEGLRQLPGVGAYTAGAIAAIAFDRKAAAVDGNVERVTARLFAVETPLPAAKPELRRLAATLVPDRRPGDFAQAMMDLGATICTPRRPACALCPFADACAGRIAGLAERLPAKAAKAVRPHRLGIAFWAVNPAGAVLLQRRPERGLLGGMMGLPTSPWTDAMPALVQATAPLAGDWRLLDGRVHHVFTHFSLELAVATARVSAGWRGAEGVWVPADAVERQGLPTVMRKVVRHVLAVNGLVTSGT